jgi:hypothetical protein
MKPCCSDHNGNPKKKYKNREEAEKAAQSRRDEGVGINLYPCEEKDGWHLTSQNAPPPIRPKNVMTPEERGLYTRRSKNRLGDLLDEEVAKQLKDEVGRNTLHSQRGKLETLQQDIDDRVESIRSHRKELAILRNNLKTAEKNLNLTRQDLSIAKHEYAITKRRINT